MAKDRVRIDTRKAGKIRIVKLSGKFSAETGPDSVKDEFARHLADGDIMFVLDLTSVSFMDSRALGITIECHKSACERAGIIKLVLSGRPKELFLMTRLYTFFECFEDLESALASFA